MKPKLVLLCVVLIVAIPSTVPAAPCTPTNTNSALGTTLRMMEAQERGREKVEARRRSTASFRVQMANAIRQQRADAQEEVLFWFRTHPHERVLPKEEVERMLKSEGYSETSVDGLIGISNPFFTDKP